MLVIAAIIIFFASRGHGSVVIRSNRVGRDGKIFCLYKFRTVDIQKNLWARFIRINHIDELPMVISVLNGDMSLVGPRPETPEFVQTMSEAIPNYGLRHRVRPGITDYAQIRYPFGSTLDDAKVKYAYDVEYIDRHYMLATNLKILFETVRIVFMGIRNE